MRIAFSVFVAVLSGCESLEERGQYLTGPDAIVWTSDDDFTVRGQDDMRGHLNATSSHLRVFLTGFPPGTEAALGDQTVTVRDNGAANLETELTALFGDVSTDDFLVGRIAASALELRPPGRSALSIPLPPQEVSRPDQHLLSIIEGPLLYPGEQAIAVERPATIYWPHGASHELLGVRAATFRGIDAIAISREVVASTRVCEGYSGPDGSVRALTLELVEHVVTLYDRRTGTSLGEQTFAPIDRCPDSTFSFAGEAFRTQTVLPEEAIGAWLRGQLANDAAPR